MKVLRLVLVLVPREMRRKYLVKEQARCVVEFLPDNVYVVTNVPRSSAG